MYAPLGQVSLKIQRAAPLLCFRKVEPELHLGQTISGVPLDLAS